MLLKVFPDYSATGLWSANGASTEPEYYDLSPSVVEDLKHMQRLYDKYNDDYLPEHERKSMSVPYSRYAYNIALKIKHEHADWTLLFYNEKDNFLVCFPEDDPRYNQTGFIEVFLTDKFQ